MGGVGLTQACRSSDNTSSTSNTIRVDCDNYIVMRETKEGSWVHVCASGAVSQFSAFDN